MHRLHAKLSWLELQAFPHTATGEWLDRHGEQRGVVRKEAAHATGKLTFSRYLPLSFDVVIPAGTVCAVSGDEPIEYETTEDVTLVAGELNAEVPARAVVGGSGGNASAGRINTITTPISSVNYVTNRSAFTGGRNAETDEAYRVRVIAAYKNNSNGTNCAYYRELALSCEGVSAATAVPTINGAGTVGVYVWGEGGAPNEALIAKLKNKFAEEREIGVDVAVSAAEVKTVNVTMRCKLRDGADFDTAAAKIRAAVEMYFAGLTVGSGVYLAEIERVALNAAPIVKLEFASAARDTAPSQAVIPQLGTLTLEELE